jgi:hypothetical protein
VELETPPRLERKETKSLKAVINSNSNLLERSIDSNNKDI